MLASLHNKDAWRKKSCWKSAAPISSCPVLGRKTLSLSIGKVNYFSCLTLHENGISLPVEEFRVFTLILNVSSNVEASNIHSVLKVSQIDIWRCYEKGKLLPKHSTQLIGNRPRCSVGMLFILSFMSSSQQKLTPRVHILSTYALWLKKASRYSVLKHTVLEIIQNIQEACLKICCII